MPQEMKNDLNWNFLHYFWVVAKNKSIKKAAIALGVSSSTLSEAIQSLENGLQGKLFVRTTRSLDFTSKGTVLFDKINPLFENQSEILEALQKSQTSASSVQFGLVPSNSLPLLFDVIFNILNYEFAQKFTVRSCESDQLETLLERGDLDIGITNRLIRKSNIGCVKIYNSRTKFFVHQKLAHQSLPDLLKTCSLGLLGSNKMNDDIQSHFMKTFDSHSIRFFVTDFISLLFEACLNQKTIIAISANQNFNLNGQLVAISDPKIQKLEFRDEQYFVWSKRIEDSQLFRYINKQIAKTTAGDLGTTPTIDIEV